MTEVRGSAGEGAKGNPYIRTVIKRETTGRNAVLFPFHNLLQLHSIIHITLGGSIETTLCRPFDIRFTALESSFLV